jgi:hypothetical protein
VETGSPSGNATNKELDRFRDSKKSENDPEPSSARFEVGRRRARGPDSAFSKGFGSNEKVENRASRPVFLSGVGKSLGIAGFAVHGTCASPAFGKGCHAKFNQLFRTELKGVET